MTNLDNLATRIAELERRVMGLNEDNSFDNSEANIIDIKERLEDLESLVTVLTTKL